MQRKNISILTIVMTISFMLTLLFSSFSYALTETTTSTTVTSTSSGSQSATPTTITKKTTNTSITTTTNNNIDQKIVSDIYARYAKESALIGTDLTVKCKNGFVTISGTVTAQSQEDQAVIVAKSIAGVKGARSNINVLTNPKNDKSTNVPNY